MTGIGRHLPVTDIYPDGSYLSVFARNPPHRNRLNFIQIQTCSLLRNGSTIHQLAHQTPGSSPQGDGFARIATMLPHAIALTFRGARALTAVHPTYALSAYGW
jgi:hypothetical protein